MSPKQQLLSQARRMEAFRIGAPHFRNSVARVVASPSLSRLFGRFLTKILAHWESCTTVWDTEIRISTVRALVQATIGARISGPVTESKTSLLSWYGMCCDLLRSDFEVTHVYFGTESCSLRVRAFRSFRRHGLGCSILCACCRFLLSIRHCRYDLTQECYPFIGDRPRFAPVTARWRSVAAPISPVHKASGSAFQ
jgi:hypothetical protein